MDSYSRLRFFGAETPGWYDGLAFLALLIGVDALSSWPFWMEHFVAFGVFLGVAIATTYHRAAAELGEERLAAMQQAQVPGPSVG